MDNEIDTEADTSVEEFMSAEVISSTGDRNLEEINRIEKRGFWFKVREIWGKTIFSDWIKDYKEEKKFKSEIRREAKRQALLELKDKMVEKYKQDELDKMSGNKKGPAWMSKIGKELGKMGENASRNLNQMSGMGGPGTNMGGQAGVSNNDIASMMGMGGQRTNTGGQRVINNNDIVSMMGMGNQQPKQQPVYRRVPIRKKKNKKKKPQYRRQVMRPAPPTYEQKQNNYEKRIKDMLS